MTDPENCLSRIEWRGDFFASALDEIRDRLAPFPRIARPFRHTVTIFLAKASEPRFDFDRVVRLRSYADLPDLSPATIGAWILSGPRGKLQIKHRGGRVDDRGPVQLVCGHGRMPSCELDGECFAPASVRIARRHHYAMTAGGAPAPRSEISERHRVTLDEERHLFRVRDGGTVSYLGEMGPRLEIKSPSAAAIGAVLATINADETIRVIPYRGIELLFQSFLSDAIAAESRVKNRELELKFDVVGEIGADTLQEVLANTPGAAFLLPFPHRIDRIRRYHVCRHASDATSEYTIVETPAGRLSQKRKRAGQQLGGVILRDTDAMFTTDRDGRPCSVERFCADNGLVVSGRFIKSQSKIPFRLRNGHAYLMSLDGCRDDAGRELAQVELEYIGNVFAHSTPTAAIATELEGIGRTLRESAIGPHLMPSTMSKHAFFRRDDIGVSQDAAMAADMNS